MSEVPPSAPQPPPYQPGGDNPRAAAKAAKAYAKASRKWYQKKRWWALAVVVVLVIIGAASGSGGGGGSNKPAASDNTGAVDNTGSTKKTDSKSSSDTKSAPAAKSTVGQVLLHTKGNGTKTTEKFTAKGDWDLAYTYDCSNFGQQGNFMVMVYGDDNNLSLSNSGVNLLGMKGSDVTHEHHGGTYYLEVNSECNWALKVTSAS